MKIVMIRHTRAYYDDQDFSIANAINLFLSRNPGSKVISIWPSHWITDLFRVFYEITTQEPLMADPEIHQPASNDIAPKRISIAEDKLAELGYRWDGKEWVKG